jgi:hypothetical protein
MVLPDGVKLEVVLCPWTSYANKMTILPFVPDSPNSILNFALEYDYGSIVGHYTPAGDAAWHRMFANLREMPVPTNPIGAELSVSGIDELLLTGGTFEMTTAD